MDEEFEELFKKGKKSRQEVDSMIQLATEVQYSVLTRKLQPGAYLVSHKCALSQTFLPLFSQLCVPFTIEPPSSSQEMLVFVSLSIPN